MATMALTAENFENTVLENDIVIIDFWASWCGPCRGFAPTFEDASNRFPDIVFAKVDTEEQQALAAHFGIQAIPTLMVFRQQIGIFQQAGALPPAALEELIGKVQALDMDQVRSQIEAQKETEAQAENEAEA